MLELLFPVTFAFIVTFFSIPVIISIANQKRLFDIPDERKVHTSQVAPLGGIAIFAGFSLASLLAIGFPKAGEFQYYIAAALVIFFTGLKDDILVISPFKKLIGQLLATFFLIHKGGLQLTNMYGFLGLNELPESVGFLVTYFTIILVINAFNLIDGIDGLAGSLGLMVTLILGFYFLKIGLLPYAILSLSLASSLLAFLIFNFQPAKIFMGDSGSMLIGLISAILVIKFINVAPGNPAFALKSSPAIGFSILLIPLLDTLRVFCIRISKRKSPFSPDKNHIHHILLNKKFTHKKIAFTLVSINLLFIVSAFFIKAIGTTLLISILILSYFALIGFFTYTNKQLVVATPRTRKSSLKLVSSRPEMISIPQSAALTEN